MDETTLIINRVLPILLLIGLGYWIRRTNFLSEATVDDLRKIVVNLALPSVLFLAFLEIELKTTYLAVFILLFALCAALFGLGRVLKPRFGLQHPYFPYLMTGFEYGMLGVSLFGSAYGLDNIRYIAVVDLGHEIFIWFVFLALLFLERDGVQNPGHLLRSFLRSPVIIGILAGIILNLLDAKEFLFERAVTGGLVATLQFLSNLTVPMILIIVGYGIQFSRHGLRDAVSVVTIRLIILIPLALLLSHFFIGELLGLEKPFQAAAFTLLILPPPFIVPLYMKHDAGLEERQYVNNVLTIYTLISLALFALYFAANPEL